MSASLSPIQTTAILQKSTTMLKHEDKAHLKLERSSSLEKILLICSPPYYTLPTILTWLKSSKNSLNCSAEKTIFFFRSLFFSSIFYRYFSQLVRPFQEKLLDVKKNFNNYLESIILNFFHSFSKCFESTFLIKLSFMFVSLMLSVQMILCLTYLCQAVFPIGLGFLVVSLVGIVRLGHLINRFCYSKRDSKRKIK